MAMNNTSNKADVNGHSHDFVGKIPDELFCKICSKVLRDPRQVVCCGQHYCQGCIERRITTNFTCPNCHAANFNHFRDVHFEQRVSNLKIHCPHYKKGCKWIGELCNLKPHLTAIQGCAYEAIPCGNNCGLVMPRRDVKEHLLKHCLQRKIRCQYCNHENTCQVITGSHFSVCPSYPVKCPNNCGQRGIKRSEVNKHEAQCPLKPMVCPFQDAGCRVQLVLKDYNDHMMTNTQQHLDMVTSSFDSLKSRAESAEKELRVARTEVQNLQKLEETGKVQMQKRLKAISYNAEELVKTCTESQKFIVHSIRSLADESFTLSKIGQPLVFQMINYSEFKRSGKVWYSAPFYVADGYKMCLAVYAGGDGTGRGSCVSISLCLMQGEFDEELVWPVELPFHLVVEILKHGETFEGGESSANAPPNPKTYMYFHADKPQERVQDGLLLEARKCENFVRHDVVEDWMLFYDAITFQITAESEFL